MGPKKKPGAMLRAFSLRYGLPTVVVIPVVVPARIVGRPAVIGVARRVVGRTVIIVAVRPVVGITRDRCARNQRARSKAESQAWTETPEMSGFGRRRRGHSGNANRGYC